MSQSGGRWRMRSNNSNSSAFTCCPPLLLGGSGRTSGASYHWKWQRRALSVQVWRVHVVAGGFADAFPPLKGARVECGPDVAVAAHLALAVFVEDLHSPPSFGDASRAAMNSSTPTSYAWPWVFVHPSNTWLLVKTRSLQGPGQSWISQEAQWPFVRPSPSLLEGGVGGHLFTALALGSVDQMLFRGAPKVHLRLSLFSGSRRGRFGTDGE